MINTKHGLVAILRHVDLAALPKANRERVMSTDCDTVFAIVFEAAREALVAFFAQPDTRLKDGE